MTVPANAIDWSATRLPGLGDQAAVLVAGAGGAMGRAVTHALVAMGARVVCAGRTEATLKETVQTAAVPERAHALVCDIGDRSDVQRLIGEAGERLGGLTGLVNCAAVGDGGARVDEVDHGLAESVLRINYLGAMWLSVAAASLMADGGRMVQVSSVAKHRAMIGGSQYAASKAALTRLVQSLAVELGPEDITVNLISPGQTPTPLTPARDANAAAAPPRPGAAATSVPLRRRGHLDDYVGVIAFLLSDLSRYVTGQDVPVEGGVMWGRVTG